MLWWGSLIFVNLAWKGVWQPKNDGFSLPVKVAKEMLALPQKPAARTARVLIAFAGIVLSLRAHSQETGNTKYPLELSGRVTATSNGLSFIPVFSLGKPAAIFNFSIGKSRLKFEPELRFSMDGKPWSFLLWWRHKLINRGKYQLTLGAHPGFAFKKINYMANGVAKEDLICHRYLAGELAPTYRLSKNLIVGVYYLYSRGLDKGAVRNTHFITLNSSISTIKLNQLFYLRVNPQFYFLKMNQQDGLYCSAYLSLENRKVPISISSLVNKAIHTRITGSKSLVWNINLAYTFRKQLYEK